MSELLIEARSLGKRFSTQAEELEIFRDLNLFVEKGSRVAIVGPSGSGKSTLLSILGGLDTPSEGILNVGPYALHKLPEKRLAEYRSSFVGFVFQLHYLLKDFSATENVALPAIMAGLPRKEAMARAKNLLEEMGLGGRLDHLPSRLSGGERQRAAIARALINTPRILLADEPTGNLDAHTAEAVRELLFKSCSLHGSTLVLVTHDMNIASKADTTFELSDGRLNRI